MPNISVYLTQELYDAVMKGCEDNKCGVSDLIQGVIKQAMEPEIKPQDELKDNEDIKIDSDDTDPEVTFEDEGK